MWVDVGIQVRGNPIRTRQIEGRRQESFSRGKDVYSSSIYGLDQLTQVILNPTF